MSKEETFEEVVLSTEKIIDRMVEIGQYWKERCLAAERLLNSVDNNINKQFVGYKEWQALQNKKP